MNHFDTVFIVDDDEITRFLLVTKLEEYSFADNYHSFRWAKEALAFLEQHQASPQELPDLIFLDINMPEMNSWEFLDAYASLVDAFPKKIRICILTSSVFEKDVERAKTHPLVDEFAVKPLRQDTLKELVEKYASQA